MITLARWSILPLLLTAMLAMNSAQEDAVHRAALEALDPAVPVGYIELAETIADTADSPQQRQLAIRLFALGATLAPEQWGRSGMLGVLELLEDEQQIRGVRALLELQEDMRPSMLPDRRIVMGSQTRASIIAFDVLSSIRSGNIKTARSLLRHSSGPREVLEQYEDDVPGGMRRLLERVESALENRPIQLTGSEYVAQLQVQSRLLGGRRETWSAALSAWQGRPLEDVAGSDLGHVLNLDLSKTTWQGRWMQP